MLDRFLCQPGHAAMLNLAPACQDVAVIDIAMAQVKPRRLDDLQDRDRGIAHAAMLVENRGRCPERRRKRAEASHQCLGKRLGIAAPFFHIDKNVQQFKLAESLVPLSSSLARMRPRCPDMWSAELSMGAELEEAGTMPNGIAQKVKKTRS